MSSSIAIPSAQASSSSQEIRDRRSGDDGLHYQSRKHRHHLRSMDATVGSPASSSAMSPSPSSASSSSTSSASPATASSSYIASVSPSRIPKAKGLSQSVPAPAPTRMEQKMTHNRRPSLLSSAISKQEAHVINIGDPDGPPRLISYLASSQGFIWNPEIFVPSYVDCDYTPLENRREPIHEIFLSDEEIAEMFPQ